MASKKTVSNHNKHHRRSRRLGGTNAWWNISTVDKEQHAAFHKLFPGDMPLQQIVDQLNNVWIDPDYVLIPVKRKVARKVIRALSQL